MRDLDLFNATRAAGLNPERAARAAFAAAGVIALTRRKK